MARDHRKLRVFEMADSLVMDIYPATKDFPPEERYGMQAQLRRAALSTATNIVEGCARRSEAEYLNFLNIATGSAAEVRYLIDVSRRLGLLKNGAAGLATRSADLVGSLIKLMDSLTSYPKPEA